uniref:Uncharacterized protein n=1 Tax=Nelumbo nucifera TaxID=4432 RepID=A0A822ZLF4_NELNU|nr:TPA_asm: hypothetical protein HUJ06_004252 [Nelumbo nucifera]
MINKGVDKVEQSCLFDIYLGSSFIWQPQPCKEQPNVMFMSIATNTTKLHLQDDFVDENIDSNRVPNQVVPSHRSVKPLIPSLGNSLNIDTPPLCSSKLVKEPTLGHFHDPLGSLKRTRSSNTTTAICKAFVVIYYYRASISKAEGYF